MITNEKNINLFVYGSLRENFFNYDKYLKGKVLSVTPAKIDNMKLYHMPYKGYPAILNGESTVYGEIIEVIPEIYDETVKAIDDMEGLLSEGNPENEYHKTLFEVSHLDSDVKEKCYVYFYNHSIDDKFEDNAQLIPHGDWVKHMTENK